MGSAGIGHQRQEMCRDIRTEVDKGATPIIKWL